MSGYILCQTKTADSPYFIENISTNIYTLEELCYYLFHNLYLIDDTVMNERLCLWLQDELNLPGLAARLRANLGKFSSLEDVLYPVFKEINYLTYEELKVLNARIQKLDRESRQVREKQKGDALMENGMYVHAIQVYQKLLEEKGSTLLKSGTTLAELIRRPELTYDDLAAVDKDRPELPWDVKQQVEINLKYDGYIKRQMKQVEQFKKLEAKKIPEDLDYEKVGSLRIEARQKLEAYRPVSIGQASRISGVSPADVSVLLVYLEQYRKGRQ